MTPASSRPPTPSSTSSGPPESPKHVLLAATPRHRADHRGARVREARAGGAGGIVEQREHGGAQVVGHDLHLVVEARRAPPEHAGRGARCRGCGVRLVDQRHRRHRRQRGAGEVHEGDVGADQLLREGRVPRQAGDRDPLATGARQRGLPEQHVPVGRVGVGDAVRGREEQRRRDQRAGAGLPGARVDAAGDQRADERVVGRVRGRTADDARVTRAGERAGRRQRAPERLRLVAACVGRDHEQLVLATRQRNRERLALRDMASSWTPRLERTPSSTRRMPDASVARTRDGAPAARGRRRGRSGPAAPSCR